MTNKLCPELIRRKTAVDPETGCWNWMGSLQTCGYGQIRIGGSISQLAHRLSWIAHRGPLPSGLHVLHHCDNPKCCNPDHLYLGTHLDNMRDMNSRKRRRKGKFSKSFQLENSP